MAGLDEFVPLCLCSHMARPPSKPAIESAAAQLRAIVLEAEEGAFVGSEDALLARLGFSRSTVRQVARLLEREGLLRVRRGINGGYFGARPNVDTIHRAVSAYLETLAMDARDVIGVASGLWVEIMRRAAAIHTDAAKKMAAEFSERILAVRLDASFVEVRELELESRAAILDLVESPYVKLIFDINIAFAQRSFPPPDDKDGTDMHRDFVRNWRNAKLMEFGTIASGNMELAAATARHAREIWYDRIWQRVAG